MLQLSRWFIIKNSSANMTSYKPTNYDVFYDFPKIADHLPKISEDLQNDFRRSYEDSEHFPNFSENFRRYLKIAEEDPKMFRLIIDLLWLIQHWNRANLSENVSKSISSHVKVTCYFHVWRYDFFARKISWYFTDVYIIRRCVALEGGGGIMWWTSIPSRGKVIDIYSYTV